MPLYDYACSECGWIDHDLFLKVEQAKRVTWGWCRQCSAYRNFEWLCPAPAAHDWGNCSQGRYFEHVSPSGEYFRDKKSFDRYLKKKGLQAY